MLEWTVYILVCSDRKTCVGCTSDLNKRLQRHIKGQVKATKVRLLVKLICKISYSDKHKDCEFEKYLKTGSGRAFLKNHLLV